MVICCLWETFWNIFFSSAAGKHLTLSKQDNQDSWLFDALGSSVPSGAFASHRQ